MGSIGTLVAELRRRGVVVHEWDGWDGRGNEGIHQIDPVGAVIHHTASGYGSAFPALVTGRPDLRGTLCNLAGNADGSLTVIASGLTWHAGAGAGPSLGPLAAYRGWLNRWTVGLEIVYPGDQPMTDEQYATALVFARTVADLFGDGDIECVRAHAETNGRGGDGKWDPGYAPGKTIDMAAFRSAAAAAKTKQKKEDDDVFDANAGNVVFKFTTDEGKVEAGVFAELLGRAAKRAYEVKVNQGTQNALLAQILAAVTDGDTDSGVIMERLEVAAREGAREGAEQAITETVLPRLTDVVENVLGEDNKAQAAEILRQMGTQLRDAAGAQA